MVTTQEGEVGHAAHQLAYDKPDAARMLGIGLRTLEEMIAHGELPYVNFGKRVVIRRATLERILEERERVRAQEE